MKKFLAILFTMLILLGCKSTVQDMEQPKDVQYLDLSKNPNRKAVKEYWEVKKKFVSGYPASAAEKRMSGCVDILAGIDSKGKLSSAKIKKSYPEGLFDKHALASLSKWKWKPTESNSSRQPVIHLIQLDFTVIPTKNNSGYTANCTQAKHSA